MHARPPRAPRPARHRPPTRFATTTAAAVVLAALTFGAGEAHADPAPEAPPADSAPIASVTTPAANAAAPASDAPAPTDAPAPAPGDDAPAPDAPTPVAGAPVATAVSLDVPLQLPYGSLLTVGITVTDAEGRPASGSVSVSATGAGVDQAAFLPLEDGRATYTYHQAEGDGRPDPAASAVLDLGTYGVQVDFTPADPTLLAPSQAAAGVTIVPRATRVAIADSDDVRQRTRTDWGYDLAARIIDGLPLDEAPPRFPVSGSVDFFVDGTFAGTAEVSGGWAFLPTTWPVAGDYTITAVYSGDARYLASTSDPWTLQVLPAPLGDSAAPAGDGTTALAETGAMDAAPQLLIAVATLLAGALLVGLRLRPSRRPWLRSRLRLGAGSAR